MKDLKLAALRSEIDLIDEKIVNLLLDRVKTARRIGEVKGSTPVFDPGREEHVLHHILDRGGDIPPTPLMAIYREILALCRNVQFPLRIACLGPEGSFSHEACLEILGDDVDCRFRSTIEETILAAAHGDADYAVVPIENSVEGAVLATLDTFAGAAGDLKVQSEVWIRVRHVLASFETPLAELKEIHSHPQPLAQCRQWLRVNMPGVLQVTTSSSSIAAATAREKRGIGAICSYAAARIHGLDIQAENIQDRPDNTTRFWLVGRGDPRPGPRNKTSLLFNVQHRPGALFYALEPLYEAKVNLTHIQSRPLPGNPFEYFFFVDFEGHSSEAHVARLIEEMRGRCTFLRVLGSYPFRKP